MVKGQKQDPLTAEEVLALFNTDAVLFISTCLCVFMALSLCRSDYFPAVGRAAGLTGTAVTTFASALWQATWHFAMLFMTVCDFVGQVPAI